MDISSITIDKDTIDYQIDYHFYVRELHDILLKLNEL